MRLKCIYKKKYRIVAALVMAVLACVYIAVHSNITAYAGNIVITGDSAGLLSITSTDKVLFNLNGLYPGDSSESLLTISNTDTVNEGFEVFMFARNVADWEYDLGRVTRLTITDGNTTLYDGMLIDFDETINAVTPIALGRIAGGSSKDLNFAIEIDGEKADNHYQEQPSNFVVTFLVNSYGSAVTPPPEEGGDDTEDTGYVEDTGDVEDTEDIEVTEDEEAVYEEEEVPLSPPIIIEDEAPTDYVELEEENIPLGIIEIEPDEIIELEEEEIPLGTVKEMPKTGERSLALYLIPGVIIIGFGLYMSLKKDKTKAEKRK